MIVLARLRPGDLRLSHALPSSWCVIALFGNASIRRPGAAFRRNANESRAGIRKMLPTHKLRIFRSQSAFPLFRNTRERRRRHHQSTSYLHFFGRDFADSERAYLERIDAGLDFSTAGTVACQPRESFVTPVKVNLMFRLHFDSQRRFNTLASSFSRRRYGVEAFDCIGLRHSRISAVADDCPQCILNSHTPDGPGLQEMDALTLIAF